VTNEEKLKVFEKYLNLIQSEQIKKFTEYCIVRFPNYFWEINAATSGKHHGKNETLVDHVICCAFIAEHVCRQFDGLWTQRQKDQLMSAILLHDGWKCGAEGEECRYTEEIIKKGKYSKDLLGKFMTAKDHPEIGYKQVLKLSAEFNLNANRNKEKPVPGRDLKAILDGILYHYGPWLDIKNKPFSLDWPFSNISVQVHNVDFMSSVNAKYWTREK
jgi:hypothetical protein